MYLSKLRLWNFRKYGSGNDIDFEKPDFEVEFKKGLNVLVGENDSGKSAIIDAMRLLLWTRCGAFQKIEEEDFYCDKSGKCSSRLRIEIIIEDINASEASYFVDWLGFNDDASVYLRLWLDAEKSERGIFPDCLAGPIGDNSGKKLHKKARTYLNAVYLKPLRDAKEELSAKKGSRISKILNACDEFELKDDHEFVKCFSCTNNNIRKYFSSEGNGEGISNTLGEHLESFSFKNDEKLEANFDIGSEELLRILEKLSLKFKNLNVGLGSHNLLFIASELLLLKEIQDELKLALIEEIEAHLHPQKQLQVINYLKSESNKGYQMIVTTHSPNIASKLDLKNLIICKGNSAFSMSVGKTKLSGGDYDFMERFLDVTKADLFFAKGVIFVEGWSEEILIPTIARIMGYPLNDYGVSVINIGNLAFFRYAKIFLREDGGDFGIRVSCITDKDGKIDKTGDKLATDLEITDNENIKFFVSPERTLEYDLAMGGLRNYINQATYLAWKINNSPNNKAQQGLLYDGWEDDLKKADAELPKFTKGKEAEKIYERISSEGKGASKVVAAQYLSRILVDKKEGIKEILKGDTQVKYIIDAIKHACGISDE